MGDALFVHGGVTDAQEARLALAGLFAAQGPSLLDARTGVMSGPGSTALVTGTSATAPMTVSIAPHNWVTSRGTANGPYLGALAAAATVNIAAAPGSGTRVDVVYVKQNDPTPGVPTPDTSPATAQPIYGVLAGTVGAGKPSLATIVGAEELATVAVSAGAVRTTDGTVLITNTARQTGARGTPVPVRSQAERDAFTPSDGDSVKRLDLGGIVQQRISGAWVSAAYAPDVAALSPGAWQAPALTGANLGSGYIAVRYRKLPALDSVQMVGVMAGPITANTDVFQLAAGFRPTAGIVIVNCLFGTNVAGQLDVRTDGLCRIRQNVSTLLSFNDIIPLT